MRAWYGDRVQFLSVVVRQAHPGERRPAYHTYDQKLADAREFQQQEGLAWPVLVDDLAGTVHQVYSGLADPTYLLDADGRVAYFVMWTHAPGLDRAIAALLAQGGRGIVAGGIDHVPHLTPSLTDGWKGIRRGLPQSFLDLETAAPGMASGIWLGYRLRPVLAPLTLRARPLPTVVGAALVAGVGAVVAGAWWLRRR